MRKGAQASDYRVSYLVVIPAPSVSPLSLEFPILSCLDCVSMASGGGKHTRPTHLRLSAFANQGTDTRTLKAYLDHRNIQHIVRTPSSRLRASRTSGATNDHGRNDSQTFGFEDRPAMRTICLRAAKDRSKVR
jgi:hypothetical protein